MNNHHLRRSRAHLDAVLNGQLGPDPLTDLITVLRAPAQPAELGGLDAALSAFTSGAGAAPTPEVSPPVFKALAGRALAVKIFAVIASAAATGGIAYAATSSASPGPHHRPATANSPASSSRNAPGAAAAPVSASASASSSTSSGNGSVNGSAAASSASGSGHPHATHPGSSPSLVGLCTAWLAHPRDVTRFASNPAYRVLISTAGGADAVEGYCTTLLTSAHPTHPAHPAHPTPPAHPSRAQHPSPTHPAHPSRAQHPSPTHPAHPSRPPAHP